MYDLSDPVLISSRLPLARFAPPESKKYSTVVTPFGRCQNYGSFRSSAPESIVRILGYK